MKQRLARLDWPGIERSLLERGFARTPQILSRNECETLAGIYGDEERFRKRIDMESHVYGRGDYSYFARPLPRIVQSLRTHLYRQLAPIANRWAEALRREVRYPPTLRAFVERCHAAGQLRPTPLILHYERDGYNRLHQDFYGEVWFPLQVTAMLSRRGAEYVGGELLLLEQRPRCQSRGEAVPADQGELVIFPSGERPAEGKRGPLRLVMRHGVSTVTSGERFALGIIFHDAR